MANFTTGLGQGYGVARGKKSGGIVPGAHPEFESDFGAHTGIDMSAVGNAVKSGAKKLFTGMMGPSESEIDSSAKYQGTMNYYNAKIARTKPTRKPSY